MTMRSTLPTLAIALTLLSTPTAWAQAPVPGAAEMPAGTSFLDKHFSLSGYLRTRFDVFDNLDLDHGLTPSGRPLFPIPQSDKGSGALTSANMRLRLEPTIRIGMGVSVHARIDILDNVVLGSTPNSFPANPWTPTALATGGAKPPETGINSDISSVRVKRAWGQVVLPFGTLSVGRMGALISWGTGFFVNSGNCIDCDLGDEGDRIAFTLPIFDHLISFAFDFGSIGPTSAHLGAYPQPFNVDRRDDVMSWALVIARYDLPEVVERYRAAGRTVIQYGLLSSLRTQKYDVPAYTMTGNRDREYGEDDLVQRDLLAFAMDAWFGLRIGGFTLDLEFAMVLSRIDNASLVPGLEMLQRVTGRQFGGVARGLYDHGKWRFALELGFASGDSAPGFGVRSPTNQLQSEPGDLDGPQLRIPGDTTLNNFRFNPDYRIDLILWRRIIGAVSDAFYARPSVRWQPLRGLTLWSAVISSMALEAASTPGGSRGLGVEFDAGATYVFDPGFELQLSYGLLVPLAGLDNTRLGLDAALAQTFHAIFAFRL